MRSSRSREDRHMPASISVPDSMISVYSATSSPVRRMLRPASAGRPIVIFWSVAVVFSLPSRPPPALGDGGSGQKSQHLSFAEKRRAIRTSEQPVGYRKRTCVYLGNIIGMNAIAVHRTLIEGGNGMAEVAAAAVTRPVQARNGTASCSFTDATSSSAIASAASTSSRPAGRKPHRHAA